MKSGFTFYGTGAAEGIPSPFCRCDVCENARQVGGHEVRSRSLFRLSETTCIDMGPDLFDQALSFGDFSKLKHLLITHTHEDHFAFMLMNMRNMARVRDESPLTIYLTDKAFEMIEFYRREPSILKGIVPELEEQGVIAFKKLEFSKIYTIDKYQVMPLEGNHIGNVFEQAANYLITLANGQTIYYGLDSGWYLSKTINELSNRHIDILISECTFGLTAGRGRHPNGHLDAYACMELFELLYEQGTLSKTSRIYLTHINHFTSTHEELSSFFAEKSFPCPINVVYDGFQISGL